MVHRCHAVGVGIYVDAVINHMTNYPSPGVGSNGTAYTKYNYPGLYTSSDFHTPCTVSNYQSAANVQDCELFGLPDLNTGLASVRQKIAGYLIMLARLSVAGFRVDAAKHIQQVELDDILAIVDSTLTAEGRPIPYYLLEVSGGAGEALSPRDYFGEAYGSGGAADITEFTFVGVGDKFRGIGGQHISQLNPNGPPGSQFSAAAWRPATSTTGGTTAPMPSRSRGATRASSPSAARARWSTRRSPRGCRPAPTATSSPVGSSRRRAPVPPWRWIRPGRSTSTSNPIRRSRSTPRPSCREVQGLRRARRRGGGRGRPGIDELHRDRVNPQIQSFERPRAEQRQVPALTEDHLVPGLDPGHSHDHAAGPTSQGRPVGLPETQRLDALDAERLEGSGGGPRHRASRCGQHALRHAPRSGAYRILDLNGDAKRTHFVSHTTSFVLAE